MPADTKESHRSWYNEDSSSSRIFSTSEDVSSRVAVDINSDILRRDTFTTPKERSASNRAGVFDEQMPFIDSPLVDSFRGWLCP